MPTRLEQEGVDWLVSALLRRNRASHCRHLKADPVPGWHLAGQENACKSNPRSHAGCFRLDVVEAWIVPRRMRNTVDVHLKIDTGMGRLGVRADDVPISAPR